MYHVKKTLADMPVTLELDQYYEWLESECNQLGYKVYSPGLIADLFCIHTSVTHKYIFFTIRQRNW